MEVEDVSHQLANQKFPPGMRLVASLQHKHYFKRGGEEAARVPRRVPEQHPARIEPLLDAVADQVVALKPDADGDDVVFAARVLQQSATL